MQKIGSRLRALRKAHGYSMKKVIAKLEELELHVTEKSIYRWENDTVIPDIKTINALSNIYDTSLISIYEDTKYCKYLNKHENKFILLLRKNSDFRKVICIISKYCKEV